MIKGPLIPLLFLLNCIAGFSQVPTTLSYQGLLTDANGAPVPDAAHTVLFNFYTQETGGTAVPALARGPISVQTFKGLFTVIIGNGQGTNNAALPSTFGDTQYWIGITPDAQSELAPRVFLTAVPYAFRAQYASNVDGSAISSGTVPNARLDTNLQDLADGSLTGSKVGTGISTSNITMGTLPAAQIDAGSIDNTKLATGIDASKITTGILSSSVLPSDAGVPVGAVIAFAGAVAPANWLICDGTAKSAATYAKLFAAIGTAWGGDATNFRLPDLRGRFLRGWNSNAAVDPDASSRTTSDGTTVIGNVVGSYQGDEFTRHDHYQFFGAGISLINSSSSNNTNSSPYLNIEYTGTGNVIVANDYLISAGTTSNLRGNTLPGSFSGGNETRPKNAYIMYIIKAQ